MCIADKILQLLSCPECHSKVDLRDAKDALYCKKCNFEFAIEESIPIMLTPSRKEELQKDIGEWLDLSTFFSIYIGDTLDW